MNQSTVILIVLSLFLGVGAWLVFLWAAGRGEFEDLEGPKHRMLEDDDEASGSPRPLPKDETRQGRGADQRSGGRR